MENKTIKKRYGKWRVEGIDRERTSVNGGGNIYLYCMCNCGFKSSIRIDQLRNGRSKQCVKCARSSKKTWVLGKTFHSFRVIKELSTRRLLCVCICGKEKDVRKDCLLIGKVKCNYCKSLKYESKNSELVTPKNKPSSYGSWTSMKQRCLNPKNSSYMDYGGRGITICPSWYDFESFYRDMGEKKIGEELDRIDVNAGYNPTNCRWVSKKENAKNKRSSKTYVHTLERKISVLEEHLSLTSNSKEIINVQERINNEIINTIQKGLPYEKIK